MVSGHTVSAYDKELDGLRSLIAQMGGLAEAQITNSIDALYKRNPDLAQQVIDADRELDSLELQLEKDAVATLAKRQPMALDLRAIIAALKMSGEIERIGDYSKNIAKRVKALDDTDIRIVRGIRDMALLVQKMLKDMLDAYVEQDDEMALDVLGRDEAVDELYNSIFRELLTYMMEDPRTITAVTHLLFVAKNIERMGDHVTNLAEIVHYMIKGELLADDRPKGDVTSFTLIKPKE
jgi:phosphate transport system protein